MNAPEIAHLAENLTEAQRRAVRGARVLYPGCWLFPLGAARGMIALGLGQRTIDGVALTPLGQKVADYLRRT